MADPVVLDPLRSFICTNPDVEAQRPIIARPRAFFKEKELSFSLPKPSNFFTVPAARTGSKRTTQYSCNLLLYLTWGQLAANQVVQQGQGFIRETRTSAGRFPGAHLVGTVRSPFDEKTALRAGAHEGVLSRDPTNFVHAANFTRFSDYYFHSCSSCDVRLWETGLSKVFRGRIMMHRTDSSKARRKRS